jgi:hypothetical protein
MCIESVLYAQNSPRYRDTITLNDESIQEIIYYSSRDSIFIDTKNKQVHLYGDAKLKTTGMDISAGYLLIDLSRKEVWARYSWDKDSNKVELPKFSDGSEEINAQSIRYNLTTKKGYIEEMRVKQDELFLAMGTAKKQANDEIHFKNGRFTTCNLEEPHYHFQLSRAVIIPEKRIVTGPLNLWVKGVPTPIVLPFSVIPQQKERTHGILFPEMVPTSIFGFGVQNLGYFIPINDRLQTSVYMNLYSRGSWGLRNNLNYAKRYAYRGNLDVGFQQFKNGFPQNTNANKFSMNWTHSMDPKANPFWNLSANVNFISDNNSKNNLDPLNPQYFNNSFNSDINIRRLFPSRPITMGMKISVRQNTIAKKIALISPVFNANVTRFFPFKSISKGKSEVSKMISRIGVTYNMEGQNRSTFEDTLLRDANFSEIGSKFMNGFNQNITVQTTAAFFKNSVKFNPSFTYGNKLNFQQIEKSYNSIANNTQIDTIQKAGMQHDLSMNATLTTILYTYYKFIGPKKSVLRHLLTPSVGIRYIPALNPVVTVNAGVDQAPIRYSPFERSLYAGNITKSAGQLTFGFNNTFELKQKSDKDTVTGYKKTRIIDILSLTGNYDFMKDSMRLSDFALNLRVSPFEWLNFVANSVFSPYAWNTVTGATTSQFATLSSQGLGRFLRTNLTTTVTLTSKESRKVLTKTKETISNTWNADYAYFALHPEYLIDFAIPWKVSFSHVYSINQNTNISAINPAKLTQLQTVAINGDVSFTKLWNLSANLNVDIQSVSITNARFNLSRNLHCWALSFNFTPIGGNKSFLLSLRNTSSLLQDAKLDIRKPPAFF